MGLGGCASDQCWARLPGHWRPRANAPPQHLGLGPFGLLGGPAVLVPGRAIMSHFNGVCRGGIAWVNVYLEVNVGLTKSNADTLYAVLRALQA
eukprot:3210993-Pyramimonas_sp.AAC.1